jgi:hypothetical protein
LPTYDARDIDTHSLKHYGILRKSGRYPWGSGGEDGPAGAGQRSKDFFSTVRDLEAKGLTRTEIAKGFGMTTTQLRDATTIAKNAQRLEKQYEAEKLRAKGWSASAIGRHMDLNESSVRQLLNPSVQERTRILENTANMLRDEVDKGGWVGIGKGAEYYVTGGISKEKLRAAVSILKDEGYEQIDVQVPQAGTNQKTTVKTLCPPGTTYKDVVTSLDRIRELVPITEDGGRTMLGILPPKPISSDRIRVNYKDVDANGRPHRNSPDGKTLDPNSGAASDGVIFVRPGVKDVNIGGSSYAQVRIDVDGTHYLKGMAMYKDDLPPGVDLVFNTNKSSKDPKIVADPKYGALKEKKRDLDGEIDKDNPFGAVISRQITELGPDGKPRLTSVMNILQEEGSWDKWSRNLSSQVLSKQSPKLAEQQLSKTYARKREEYEEIMALTNPTVRKHLLDKFANSADSDAVHLSAAGLPRSSYHVILPFNSLKDSEIYAPNFNQGERVALIRYPHGGTFEIPELTVNNNAPVPKSVIGRAKDAVGINYRVAERLSGADFDGDFVMVIPNDKGSIKSTPALRQLENFDPQTYKLPDEAPRMSARTKGKQMGLVSNLITDMTIQKAPMDEIARAVKHSMVVIDAEKHHLDYKRSARDNGISALMQKYQNKPTGGASTLISRATSEERVLKRRPTRASDGGPIDRATGKLQFTPTGETRIRRQVLKDGTVKLIEEPILVKSTKLAETDDARTLLSKDGGTVIERVYADHSNRLKALANVARKELVNGPDAVPDNPTARRVYKDEVDKLKLDLQVALKNSPRERQAQLIANSIIALKKEAQPGMDDATLKKVKSQALQEARLRAGAKKELVDISPRQWEAIQAGAVSKTMLRQILDNADIEQVKALATPRPKLKMDSAAMASAKRLAEAGKTQAEIAQVLGVSLTTLKEGLSNG